MTPDPVGLPRNPEARRTRLRFRDTTIGRFTSIALPFLIVAAALSIGFLRPKAEVELSLNLNHLTFEVDQTNLDESEALFEPTEMPIQISGFDSIELGAGTIGRGEAKNSYLPGDEVTRTTIESNGSFPTLKFYTAALHSLKINSDTRITLDWWKESPQNQALAITLSQDDSSSGSFALTEKTSLDCFSCKIAGGTSSLKDSSLENLTFRAKSRHLVRFRGKHIRLTMWPERNYLLGNRDLVLRNGQRIETIRLSGNQQQSSVIGDGRIRFPSIVEQVPISSGDILVADGLSGASIVSIRIDGGIQVSIRGIADSVLLGSRGSSLSQFNPSLFQYVTSRKDLAVFYTGIGVFGSVLLSVLTRISTTRKGEDNDASL
jgi:hypothetical protein